MIFLVTDVNQIVENTIRGNRRKKPYEAQKDFMLIY